MWGPRRLPQVFRESCKDSQGLESHHGGGREADRGRSSAKDKGNKEKRQPFVEGLPMLNVSKGGISFHHYSSIVKRHQKTG